MSVQVVKEAIDIVVPLSTTGTIMDWQNISSFANATIHVANQTANALDAGIVDIAPVADGTGSVAHDTSTFGTLAGDTSAILDLPKNVVAVRFRASNATAAGEVSVRVLSNTNRQPS